MDIFSSAIGMLGGLGMFLFGMKIMSEGLEKSTGDKMKSIIESLTSNLIKSVIVGAVVAALTQSSSATTVMVIGFINAGMMTLRQGVGIIMGANIGTTITAQILRLSGNAAAGTPWYLLIFKPDILAPVALIVGAVLIFTAGKKEKLKCVGEIIIGFGILFIGMQNMEGSVTALKETYEQQFQNLFASMTNPVLGILSGAGVTALIQSSSASIGILQAVATTGAITFAAAVPIIMGQNIGTCITAILSSIGASKNAKRAACVHLYFNVIGTIIFLVVIYALRPFIPFWDSSIYKGDIANFHTIFNVVNTLILLPFAGVLVKLANLTIRSSAEEVTGPGALLDKRFLSKPAVAISNTTKAMVEMAKTARQNVQYCLDMIKDENTNYIDNMKENENTLDQLEILLTNYLTEIADTPLNAEENKLVSGYFHTVNDIERIGDYCDNIGSSIGLMVSQKIKFTDYGKKGLSIFFDAVEHITDLTVQAFEANSTELAERIEPLEEVIDDIKENLEKEHLDRLKQKVCSVEAGVVFLEILSNLERIADHCSNVGVAIIQNKCETPNFNTHEYLKKIHKEMPDRYRKDYMHFKEKYALPKAE